MEQVGGDYLVINTISQEVTLTEQCGCYLLGMTEICASSLRSPSTRVKVIVIFDGVDGNLLQVTAKV